MGVTPSGPTVSFDPLEQKALANSEKGSLAGGDLDSVFGSMSTPSPSIPQYQPQP